MRSTVRNLTHGEFQIVDYTFKKCSVGCDHVIPVELGCTDDTHTNRQNQCRSSQFIAGSMSAAGQQVQGSDSPSHDQSHL